MPNTVYAIGPVRGQAALLRKLVERILRDVPRRPSEQVGADEGAPSTRSRRAKAADLVFLGDLIGSGSDGLGVLDYLQELAAEPALKVTPVLGSQEYRLCRFLSGQCDGARWLGDGGVAFLVSNGVEPRLGASPFRLRPEVEAVLAHRRALLDAMPPSVTIGDVLFSHGGGAPQVPVKQQTVEDLVLGVGEGPPRRRSDGLWSVHAGPLVEPLEPDSGSFGLSTGAHYSQRLVALRIDADGGLGLLEACLD
ncbi:MAG: hypothetical protein AAGG47_11210 [Pseudomonadota bacterium]